MDEQNVYILNVYICIHTYIHVHTHNTNIIQLQKGREFRQMLQYEWNLKTLCEMN